MSGYYKNNILLTGALSNTGGVLSSYYSNITVNTNYNLGLTAYGGAPFTGITETPNATSIYKINGTDISTYCIAMYIESGTAPTMPTWCTAIRAILVGGGSIGGPTTFATNVDYQVAYNNSGYNYYYGATNTFHHYTQYNQLQHTISPGQGGGGGGFIYISNLPTSGLQSISATKGTGGTTGNGTATTLTVVINGTTYTFTASAGTINASNVSAGGVPTITAGAPGTNSSVNGSAGAAGSGKGGYDYQYQIQAGNSTQQVYASYSNAVSGVGGTCLSQTSTYTTATTYGKGGGGGVSNGASAQNGVSGGYGNDGYYRIYYLY
jgi:hypothetical protein